MTRDCLVRASKTVALSKNPYVDDVIRPQGRHAIRHLVVEMGGPCAVGSYGLGVDGRFPPRGVRVSKRPCENCIPIFLGAIVIRDG